MTLATTVALTNLPKQNAWKNLVITHLITTLKSTVVKPGMITLTTSIAIVTATVIVIVTVTVGITTID